jgi:hypothetical protein
MSHPFMPVTTTKIRQSEKRHTQKSFSSFFSLSRFFSLFSPSRSVYSLAAVLLLTRIPRKWLLASIISLVLVFLSPLLLFIDGGG